MFFIFFGRSCIGDAFPSQEDSYRKTLISMTSQYFNCYLDRSRQDISKTNMQ